MNINPLNQIKIQTPPNPLRPDILCPYCLKELHSKDITVRCNICGTEAPTPKSGKEMIWSKIPINKVQKCGCGGIFNVRECGHCTEKLPSDILEYKKYLRFSILGITGSGKTNFLTTMLHELRSTTNSPWVLSAMDTATMETFQENDEDIYVRRQPVPATSAGIAPRPQLWRIKDRSKMTNNTIPSYSLTIFDGAGEDCEHINPVISRYINGSKSLIILFDPLALPSVARELSKNAPDILNWSEAYQN